MTASPKSFHWLPFASGCSIKVGFQCSPLSTQTFFVQLNSTSPFSLALAPLSFVLGSRALGYLQAVSTQYTTVFIALSLHLQQNMWHRARAKLHQQHAKLLRAAGPLCPQHVSPQPSPKPPQLRQRPRALAISGALSDVPGPGTAPRGCVCVFVCDFVNRAAQHVESSPWG